MAAIKVSKDGPYLVTGGLPLAEATIGANKDGESIAWKDGRRFEHAKSYALCRCGHSGNKPFCDGTHAKIDFDGTETASHEPYIEQARMIEGPAMSLSDAERLCAFARFCDPNGQVWSLVEETDEPAARRNFVRQVGDCPSGRLVAWDNETGKPVEPHYAPSISVVEDPVEKCSGPLWVRGGVQLTSADGFAYEIRNRVTLCRCGASKNKPFCDGSHAAIKFNDDIQA